MFPIWFLKYFNEKKNCILSNYLLQSFRLDIIFKNFPVVYKEHFILYLIQYFLYLINLFSKTIWKIVSLACSLNLKQEYKFCQSQRHLWLQNDSVKTPLGRLLLRARRRRGRNQFCPVTKVLAHTSSPQGGSGSGQATFILWLCYCI